MRVVQTLRILPYGCDFSMCLSCVVRLNKPVVPVESKTKRKESSSSSMETAPIPARAKYAHAKILYEHTDKLTRMVDAVSCRESGSVKVVKAGQMTAYGLIVAVGFKFRPDLTRPNYFAYVNVQNPANVAQQKLVGLLLAWVLPHITTGGTLTSDADVTAWAKANADILGSNILNHQPEWMINGESPAPEFFKGKKSKGAKDASAPSAARSGHLGQVLALGEGKSMYLCVVRWEHLNAKCDGQHNYEDRKDACCKVGDIVIGVSPATAPTAAELQILSPTAAQTPSKSKKKRKSTQPEFPVVLSAAYFLGIVEKIEKLDDPPNVQWPWRHWWNANQYYFDEEPGPIPMGAAVSGMFDGRWVMVNPAEKDGRYAEGLGLIAADIVTSLNEEDAAAAKSKSKKAAKSVTFDATQSTMPSTASMETLEVKLREEQEAILRAKELELRKIHEAEQTKKQKEYEDAIYHANCREQEAKKIALLEQKALQEKIEAAAAEKAKQEREKAALQEQLAAAASEKAAQEREKAALQEKIDAAACSSQS